MRRERYQRSFFIKHLRLIITNTNVIITTITTTTIIIIITTTTTIITTTIITTTIITTTMKFFVIAAAFLSGLTSLANALPAQLEAGDSVLDLAARENPELEARYDLPSGLNSAEKKYCI